MPNTLPHMRLGFSMSKKHLPLASSRNRLRRVISESFSRNYGKLEGDIAIFTVKKIEKSEIINNLLEGMDNKMNSEKNSKSNNYRRSIFPSQKLSLHQEYSNEENKSNINYEDEYKKVKS